MMDLQFVFPWSQFPFWITLAFAALAAAAIALRRLERRREQRIHTFVEAALAPRLLEGVDARARRPLFWLTLGGCALLLLTAAQPRWGAAWSTQERGSRDIMILLDTSESMRAQDLRPDRLTRARQKIESLAERCPADRFGLIAFSGEAALQCPPTLDHAHFRTVLNTVNTDTLSVEGTDIAAALREAARAFEEDIARSGEMNRHARAILLLSDGEQVGGDAVAAAAELEPYAGVYVVGIGNPEGAEVRFPQWILQYLPVPNASRPHHSRLDEDTLMRIAERGNGAYVRSRADNADIDFIHRSLENVAARAAAGDLRFSHVNRYRWPLAAAIACFAAEGLWLVLLPVLRARNTRRAINPEEAVRDAA